MGAAGPQAGMAKRAAPRAWAWLSLECQGQAMLLPWCLESGTEGRELEWEGLGPRWSHQEFQTMPSLNSLFYEN